MRKDCIFSLALSTRTSILMNLDAPSGKDSLLAHARWRRAARPHFFDMPLNAHPPTVDAPSFDMKCDAAEAASLVDFALWGGLVPGKLDCLEELAARGVIGFKAFMSRSGTNDFRAAD